MNALRTVLLVELPNFSKKGKKKKRKIVGYVSKYLAQVFLYISVDIKLQDLVEISFHKLNDNCTCLNYSFR